MRCRWRPPSACRQGRRAAAALVRILGASHALCRASITLRAETLMAVAEDIVGSLVEPRLPPHPHRQRPWRQRRRHRRAGLDARPQALRRGADRRPHLFPAGARGDRRAARSREPGGMGHACEFETAMIQHIRPELVKMERAATTYPDPGSTLSHHRSARRLGGPHLSRFRRSLAERHARRSLARDAGDGREVLRGGGRRARRLHRGFSRLDDSGGADMSQALKVGVIGLGFFGAPPRPHLCRSSGGRTGRRLRPRSARVAARRRQQPARRASTTSTRCWRCPDSMRSASACRTGCMRKRRSPRPKAGKTILLEKPLRA